MASEIEKEIKLEIGHVLFMDIVGYSKLLINEQRARRETLNRIVRETEQFRDADAAGTLIKSPTGDGMALVFRGSPEEPVECALEISRALKAHPELPLRMGVHSGPVSAVTDVNDQTSVAGAGINTAQRVMDCGDTGHILISKHVAEDLEQYGHWQPLLHDLGECDVKHGVRVHIVNLYTDELGNREPPEKFKRAGVEAAVPAPKSKSKYFLIAAAVIMVAGAAAFFVFRSGRLPKTASTPPPAPEKSIAVLPFENLSRDPDNAYFATGIQDEILTRLAKIGALKVISHTSTQQYSARPGNLPDIARQLGVANILEGSVQRAGDQVHINAQLIRAATDEHLWAESYDRKLENIFGVEAEVATSVAEALKAKLTHEEQRTIAGQPTNNPAAYEAYLRGVARWRNVDTVKRLEAIHDFEDAVRLDSQFVDAWARLARANALACRFNATADAKMEAEKSLASAIRVGGNQPEVQLAQGFYQFWVLRDYETARKTFESLRPKMPNSPDISEALYLITNTLGRWDETRRWTEASISLNPLDPLLRLEDAYVHEAMRDFAGAIRAYDDALKIWPNDNSLIAGQAELYQELGDLDRADHLLGRLNLDVYIWGLDTICEQAKLRRRYRDAIAFLEKYKSELTKFTSRSPGARAAFQIILGDMERLAGDSAAAQSTYSAVRRELEELLAQQPASADWICSQLSETFAGLGDREQALTFAQRANDRVFQMGNANAVSKYEEVRARIESRFAMVEAAIPRLERLLNADYGWPITPALLRLDPDFDLLRGDPRFEKLAHSDGK
jgi:TolB-like protein/class 3 adenylate cyclase